MSATMTESPSVSPMPFILPPKGGGAGQIGVYDYSKNIHLNIPSELHQLPQWVVWKVDVRKGKATKVPYRGNSWTKDGEFIRPLAKPDDSSTWSTFKKVTQAWLNKKDEALKGVGFVFSVLDPYCGVDLDNSLDENRQIRPWALPYIKKLMPCYLEVSQSGSGIHVIARASLVDASGEDRSGTKVGGFGPDGKGAVEIYDCGRYFALTGDLPNPEWNSIEDRNEEINELYALIKAKAKEDSDARSAARSSATGSPVAHKPVVRAMTSGNALVDDDDARLKKAGEAANGATFNSLFYGGDKSAYSDDGSSADFALLNLMAFWFGPDHHRMDRVFRRSALMRDKWDRDTGDETYGSLSISKVLEGKTDFYDPNYRSGPILSTASAKSQIAALVADPPKVSVKSEDSIIDDAHRIATRVMKEHFNGSNNKTLVYWSDEFHSWEQSHYRTVPKKELDATVSGEVHKQYVDNLAAQLAAFNTSKGEKKNPPKLKSVSTGFVADVVQALTSQSLLKKNLCPNQPAWLDGDGPWPAEEVLPMKDALVHVPSVVAKKASYSIRPTPNFFGPYSLNYSYDEKAENPAEWLKFLGEVWPNDPEAIRLIQEWFGYMLTPDTSQQKVAMILGPKRSGKGTLSRVLTALLGPENVVNPTLSSLSEPFGLAPLIGKPAAIIADARIGRKTDTSVVVERLLSISGEDSQTINRKGRDQITMKLPTRFTILTNELPRIRDASEALSGRMVILEMTQTFYGREDKELLSRLLKELSGILKWSLVGWARLHEQGRFTEPGSSENAAETMKDIASPIGAFVRDKCKVAPAEKITTIRLFTDWKNWCLARGQDRPGEESEFGRKLRAAVAGVKKSRHRDKIGGERDYYYEGIDLLTDGERWARDDKEDPAGAQIPDQAF